MHVVESFGGLYLAPAINSVENRKSMQFNYLRASILLKTCRLSGDASVMVGVKLQSQTRIEICMPQRLQPIVELCLLIGLLTEIKKAGARYNPVPKLCNYTCTIAI